MASKKLYYLALFVGSTIGGFVPSLWGASFLSFSSLIFSSAGAILGIIVVYKTTT
jgi:uncharacterized membrane protein YeaQ/YmgE (transglycosylase-associated protein family)